MLEGFHAEGKFRVYQLLFLVTTVNRCSIRATGWRIIAIVSPHLLLVYVLIITVEQNIFIHIVTGIIQDSSPKDTALSIHYSQPYNYICYSHYTKKARWYQMYRLKSHINYIESMKPFVLFLFLVTTSLLCDSFIKPIYDKIRRKHSDRYLSLYF